MNAADFEGCVRVFSGKKTQEQKITIDIDKVRTSGNLCPSGFAYLGAGQCQQWDCISDHQNDPRLSGKGWSCRKNMWGGRGGLQFSGQIVRATTAEYCPLEEPQIGNNNSCWNGMTEDEIKKGIIMYRVPPTARIDDGTIVNCNAQDQALIEKVFNESPANEADVMPGDIILSVDGESSCKKFVNMTHSSGQMRSWVIQQKSGATKTINILYRELTIPEQIQKVDTNAKKVVD